MITAEELISNFELKRKQLVAEQNANHLSGDNSSFALNAYFENVEQIDRLNFAIKKLMEMEEVK
jgi:hypothetical protein